MSKVTQRFKVCFFWGGFLESEFRSRGWKEERDGDGRQHSAHKL